MSGVYYNEIDPFCCAWLAELMKARLIPEGDIDNRSIADVKPEEVRHYSQRHWFAGIAGWPLALGLAGWGDRPCDTGSCPCPPFSSAGKKKQCPACGGRVIPCPVRTGYFICLECEHGWHADGRHLWPEFWRLIRDVRPATVFGEQVSGANGLVWLAGVRASLERIGYAVGSADLPAASVGAPHRRQRLFWVAHLGGQRWERGQDERGPVGQSAAIRDEEGTDAKRGGTVGRVAVADGGQSGDGGLQRGRQHGQQPPDGGTPGGLGHADGAREGPLGGVPGGAGVERAGGTRFWDDFWIVHCSDRWPDGRRKSRRVEPGTFPLVARLPRGVVPGGDPSVQEALATAEGRVARLRGYGNAIVPQVAATFVRAFLEAERDLGGGPP